MVKTLLSLLFSALLLAGAAVGEYFFVKTRFQKMDAALLVLEEKTLARRASADDGEAVKALWDSEKRKLHIVIPHSDISYIDYWLSEAIGYLETENYEHALSKIRVLVNICRQLPRTYTVDFENVF